MSRLPKWTNRSNASTCFVDERAPKWARGEHHEWTSKVDQHTSLCVFHVGAERTPKAHLQSRQTPPKVGTKRASKVDSATLM